MGIDSLHVMLIGPRRAGKTSVGRELAKQLDLPSVDTDDLLTACCGKPLGVWIATHGWQAFRSVERQVVEESLAGPRSVISTGGGIVVHRDLAERCRSQARIVYLRVHPNVLAQRAKLDSNPSHRPSLDGLDPVTEAFVTFADRDDAYRALCHVMIDAEGDLRTVVMRALAVTMSQR